MELLSSTIRQKYLDFFASKQHAVIPSAPLVPENDPSVLFNTAGMQPLVPYLLGEVHPMGKRITDVQKCVRTGDIDDVGDDTHLTFFEMLGNWSLGDYFKKESIEYSWEFLTSPEWLALDPRKISVTVFEGDQNAPVDEESVQIWKDIGMPVDKIAYLPAEDNWWAAGPTGPCGPDTEIFWWVGEGLPPVGSNKGTDSKNWMEIWNNVFMQYNRVDANTLLPLPAPCVDTGMGLERITATLNGKTTVYATNIFREALQTIKDIV
jgi:alanyl-tRNA synthetase